MVFEGMASVQENGEREISVVVERLHIPKINMRFQHRGDEEMIRERGRGGGGWGGEGGG